MTTTGVTLRGAAWLKRYGSGAPPTARLLCFHHAGGSAGMYRGWSQLLPPSIEPVAVQLPGRAERLRERPYSAMAPLVEALAEVVAPLLDMPYACYGLSMGAKVCWALTHRLRDEGRPMPLALYLASAAAPGLPEGRVDWNVPDEVLVEYLRTMGGTTPEIFAHPQLLASLLPTLRADLTLVDSFHFEPATPVAVPIRAFAGADDIEGGPERMRGWGRQTTAGFTLEAVPGGHFFDADGERRLTQVIAEDVARALG
ncbi:thioesterase II family protein [Micromonospora sp. RTGN7]|uniref:thioesterase II family protein n=1 Tax=Micromonospora sp. RTGN7 TaxID=3016526 RepID=UPI0029FF3D3E|nr:thioesterase domain-containing protein [Micromonospora sp. RTGN7]